jgi:hypothetical protein
LVAVVAVVLATLLTTLEVVVEVDKSYPFRRFQ